MKKITILILAIIPFLSFSQDISYTFVTDKEGWTVSGGTLTNDGSGHLVLDNFTSGFPGARGPEQSPTLSDDKYTHVKIVVENSTDFTTWQILNHDLGNNIFNNSTSTDFIIPTVALGAGYSTFYVPIPANSVNSGAIDRISIRAKGTVNTGAFKIDEFTIIDQPATVNEFVANPSFDDTSAYVGFWALSNDDANLTLSTDSNSGPQSGRLDIVSTPSPNFVLQNSYIKTFDSPQATVSDDFVRVTWDMKSNSTNIALAPRFKMDKNAGGTNQFFVSAQKVSTADTWETLTQTKRIDLESPVGTMYNTIKDFGLAVNNSVASDYVLIDNIVIEITIGGVTLSLEKNNLDNIFIYPNPVKDFLNFQGQEVFKNIEVLTVAGKRVLKTKNIIANKLDVSNLTNGLYLIKLENSDGSVITKKIIKQ